MLAKKRLAPLATAPRRDSVIHANGWDAELQRLWFSTAEVTMPRGLCNKAVQTLFCLHPSSRSSLRYVYSKYQLRELLRASDNYHRWPSCTWRHNACEKKGEPTAIPTFFALSHFFPLLPFFRSSSIRLMQLIADVSVFYASRLEKSER